MVRMQVIILVREAIYWVLLLFKVYITFEKFYMFILVSNMMQDLAEIFGGGLNCLL